MFVEFSGIGTGLLFGFGGSRLGGRCFRRLESLRAKPVLGVMLVTAHNDRDGVRLTLASQLSSPSAQEKAVLVRWAFGRLQMGLSCRC